MSTVDIYAGQKTLNHYHHVSVRAATPAHTADGGPTTPRFTHLWLNHKMQALETIDEEKRSAVNEREGRCQRRRERGGREVLGKVKKMKPWKRNRWPRSLTCRLSQAWQSADPCAVSCWSEPGGGGRRERREASDQEVSKTGTGNDRICSLGRLSVLSRPRLHFPRGPTVAQ